MVLVAVVVVVVVVVSRSSTRTEKNWHGQVRCRAFRLYRMARVWAGTTAAD